MKQLALLWALILSLNCAVAVAADPVGAAATAATASSASQPEDNIRYIIGPGDTIQVFVWRNAELSTTVPVRPDGKISTPLAEDVTAVGKTSSQLARDIETSLSQYIRNPQVNVIVTVAQSAFSNVTVIGKVREPKSVPYREGMTLLDVALAVGGLDQFAAGNRSKLVRKGPDGKTKEMRVRLADLVKEGKLRENILVRPGDVLLVPESRF